MIKCIYRFCIAVAMVLIVAIQGLYAASEPVSFESSAPLMVAIGEPFPVEFKLNAKPDSDTFVAPIFGDSFNIVAGPSISNGTSIQIINGDMTRKVNYTYTYILIAQQSGTMTIPAAAVMVDGKRVLTNTLTVEAVQESQAAQSQAKERSASSRIAADDLLLRLVLSKSSVYKGEPIHASFKIYSRVDIANYENLKMPQFNGFWAQDITSQQSPRPVRESYNGKIYDTYTIKDYLLYPQHADKIAIEPMSIDIIAQIVVQSRNIDPFFGGGHEYYNVTRHLETARTPIEVMELPANAPASFSGAVGRYTIEMPAMESTTIKSNAAATLRIKVSGEGNIAFLQAPKIQLPEGFEQYNVRTTESIQNSSSGSSGYKEFEYPFIARKDGDYRIQALEFSYFDPVAKSYNTINTTPFSITVTPDSSAVGESRLIRNSVASKENVSLLESDIRFIKLGKGNFTSRSNPWILEWTYLLVVALISLLYVALFIMLRRLIRDSKNEALRRGKRASKQVVQRFKSARIAMEQGHEHTFYEEMLRGLWGYMSDKFNIPVANLTKESMREELARREFDSTVAQSFADIITRCDEMQYSPMASSQMGDVYGQSLKLLSEMEELFKRKK